MVAKMTVDSLPRFAPILASMLKKFEIPENAVKYSTVDRIRKILKLIWEE